MCKIAYLAGVFDGEGHAGMCKRGGRTTKQFFLAVEMCCREVVEQFAKEFGGNIYVRDRRAEPGRANHRITYRWQVTAKRARDAYTAMEPWLIEKRGKLPASPPRPPSVHPQSQQRSRKSGGNSTPS